MGAFGKVRYIGLLAGFALVGGCGGGGSTTTDENGASMFVVQDTNLLRQDATGAHQTLIATSNGAPFSAVSADGMVAAVPTRLANGTYSVYMYEGNSAPPTPDFTGLPESNFAISPDRMALAYNDRPDGISGTGQVKVANRLTGATTNWGPPVPQLVPGNGIAWDPQNRYIAVSHTTSGEILLVPKPITEAAIVVGAGTGPSFSPDGATLAFVTPSHQIGLYSVQARTVQTVAANDRVERVVFNSDGKTLLVTAMRPDGPSSMRARAATLTIGSRQLNYVRLAPVAPQLVVGPSAF